MLRNPYLSRSRVISNFLLPIYMYQHSYGHTPFIADCLRSLEVGFTAFRLGNENFSTKKENFDFKENRKLKHSHFELC